MKSILKEIISAKQKEIDLLVKKLSENPHFPQEFEKDLKKSLEAKGGESPSLFSKALTPKTGLAVIAEIKRRSPSKGILAEIPAPEFLAKTYVEGGASAISVLTDSYGFGGSLSDLESVSRALGTSTPRETQVPLLRKDFIIHPIQIAEAKRVGAAAVLLIAAIFKSNFRDLEFLLHETSRMGLEALVEVHSEEELDLSLEAGAKIIGVNQRNLNDFSMHPELFETLISKIPSDVICVAESGIRSFQDARKLQDLGYHAILVGELLVRSSSPAMLIQQLRGKR